MEFTIVLVPPYSLWYGTSHCVQFFSFFSFFNGKNGGIEGNRVSRRRNERKRRKRVGREKGRRRRRGVVDIELVSMTSEKVFMF